MAKVELRDIEKIAQDTFLKHIEIRSTVSSDLWTVIGDPTQLHQVMLNLCVNARDAMPNGGTLSLSAHNVILEEHCAELPLEAQAGPYICLQVADNGTGIPSEVIEKIFDPFFTTKELGKGTGLGLSTTLGIIKSHSGFIRVESKPAKGTRFRVFLPAQTEASSEASAQVVAELPLGHEELILVVDDESAVRQISQQTLETFGYRVLLAANGAEALVLFTSKGTEIAAVLTDMMMPVMDGPALIEVLRKLSPDLPIIASSGLALGSRAASFGVNHFLPKPYSAETLLQALQTVLAAR